MGLLGFDQIEMIIMEFFAVRFEPFVFIFLNKIKKVTFTLLDFRYVLLLFI